MRKSENSIYSLSPLVLLNLFLGSLFIFKFKLFLTWDAAYHAVSIMQNQEFMYFSQRWILKVMQSPEYFARVWLQIENLTVLTGLYGSLYSFYPYICGLGIFGLLHKDSPKIMACLLTAMISACFLYLFHPLNEQLIGFCLLLLNFAILWRWRQKLSWPWIPVFAFTNFCLLGTHASASLLFGFQALATILWIRHRALRWTVLLLSMVGLVYRGFLTFSMEWNKVQPGYLWDQALGGLPFPHPTRDIPLLTALLILVSLTCNGLKNKTIKRCALPLLLVSQVLIHYWIEIDSGNLMQIQVLRSFLTLWIFLSLVWFFVAVTYQRIPSSRFAVALSFCLVFYLFHGGMERRQQIKKAVSQFRMMPRRCVESKEFYGPQTGLLSHWGSYYEILLEMQKTSVKTAIAHPPFQCQDVVHGEKFAVVPWTKLRWQGLFDFQSIRQKSQSIEQSK